jgi:hypothetical protein
MQEQTTGEAPAKSERKRLTVMSVRHDSATAGVHALPGPVGGQPPCDGIGEWSV